MNSTSSAKEPTTGWKQAQAHSWSWAKPLAQDFVVVHRVRDLGREDQWVCVGSPDIIRLRSGKLIASMEPWLQTPTDGREGGIDYPNHCLIKASDDRGRTWKQISTNGVTWGSLFYVKDAVYMIGNDPRKRTILITCSIDDGQSWQKAVTLFDDSRYHGSATPVLVKNGHVYRAFEDMDRGSASLVLAGNLAKDLLDPSAWRMSNKVEPPRHTPSLSRSAAGPRKGRDWIGNSFLEGNVIDIRGEIHVLLRTRIDVQLTAGVASVCKLEDDGRNMNYRFVQFYPMIGGQNKFKILYDDVSQLYWTCTTFVPDTYQDPEPLQRKGFKGNPGNMRRILLLCYSLDGLNWLPAGCVAMSHNPLESFHYSSQVVDGNDLLVLSRSSMGGRLPYNNHDTNMITLHRVKDFRSLALDLRQDFSYSTSP
jgi:hypothetical protein